MTATLFVDTESPFEVDDDVRPSQSDPKDDYRMEDCKPPSVVTPDRKLPPDNDFFPTSAAESTESGDTESESSVASSPEALDILFGKVQAKEGIEQRVDPEGVTGEEAQKEEELATMEDLDFSMTGSTCLPSPFTKINRVSITAANFSRSSTPSHRCTAVTGTGLSELSKQLRILQAKNQYMQSEMERCHRQLRIMSESKGVSVVDLLKSLELACAREAPAELQSQIDGLKAQLEALQTGKSPSRAGTPRAISKATELEHESLKQQIAALQLQVGNFEELDARYQDETKSLYDKVQTHQAASLTLEATLAQQSTWLNTERARTLALEAEIKALREERDMLKEKQNKRMADSWQHALHRSRPFGDEGEHWESEVQKYLGLNKMQRDEAASIPAPTNYPPMCDWKTSEQSGLKRTFSDPALWTMDPDAKAPITKNFVASMLPKYSSSYKQWSYDLADDSHRTKLYVKQIAKNIELEVLCRHQHQAIQEMQEDSIKAKGRCDRLEQERNVALAQKSIFEQEASTRDLELRLELEQAETLRVQLKRREEEFSLKEEQLQSRLEVSKERIVDVEGQLSSLYVAFELLQADRSEEQTEQAELKMRLVDADMMVAKQMSQSHPSSITNDSFTAQQLSPEYWNQMEDGSESESATLRQRVGMLTPSPRRKSKLSLFSRSSSSSSLCGLPPPPIADGGRRASATYIGLPPSGPSKRRTIVGSKSHAPPPPGTTICKGFLMQMHCRKKKIFGDGGVTWKRHYMVLKRGDGIMEAGTFSLFYGEEPCAQVKGAIPHLIRGISTVSFSAPSNPDDKPFSFVIRINPNDPKAPEVFLAAYSAGELQPWKSIFQDALTIDVSTWSESDQRRAENLMAAAMARNYKH